MATFPAVTGDVLTAAIFNGLPAFTVQTAKTANYTVASGDEYQQLIQMNKSSAADLSIPTDATYNFPIGTVITVLNLATNAVTIKAVTSGTTIVISSGAVLAQPILGQYKTAVLIKLAANNWAVAGAIS